MAIVNAIAFIDFILKGLSNSIMRIIFAILIFLVGFIIGKILGRSIYRILNELSLNRWLISKKIRVNAEQIISETISYIIYFFSILLALEQLDIANTIIYIFSAGVIILILMSFFLALRDTLPNFIAGLYLYSRESLKPGNKIEIDNIKGVLIKIDLFHIQIKNKKGDIIYIPNSSAIRTKIVTKNNKN